MSLYEEIRSGAVELTSIIMPPRTVSSALGRSLNASKSFDLFVFEPEGDELAERVEEILAEHNTPADRPLRVLTKMCSWINGQYFHPLMLYSQNIVLLMRNPQAQALSSYRAVYNKRSGRKMTQAELEKLKRQRLTVTLDLYVRGAWSGLKRHIAQLDNHHERGARKNWCILDGDMLRASPEATLRRLCRQLDITYSPAMINNWSRGNEKMVGGNQSQDVASFFARVRRSNGLKPSLPMTPPLESFSASVRREIIVNLQNYVRFLARPQALAPRPEELQRLMAQELFHKISPVTAYSFASLWPDRLSKKRQAALAEIKAQRPEYETSYKIIDRTAEMLKS